MTGTGTVTFRFRPGAGEADRAAVVDRLRREGAQRVEPLLPGSPDETLARLFLAEGDCARLLDLLRAEEQVEAAEQAPERRLIR